MRDDVALLDQPSQVAVGPAKTVDYLEEVDVPAPAGIADHSLRLLARWLLSAARKGAPIAAVGPVECSQNSLEVALEAKVGSDNH